jgi:hypothetical protein
MPDYDLEPPPDHDREIEHAPWQPRPPRRGGILPILLALLVLLVAGVAVYFVFYFTPHASAPSAPPAPPAAPGPAATAAPSRGPLPALDDSDVFVREIAARLSAHPELARWLARTSLVRTLAATVASIAEGRSPRHSLDFLAPKQRFRAAANTGGRTVADPASYAGYELFADAVASIDASAAADAYRATEPLFDAAYRELGHLGGFRPALDVAIRELLAAPAPSADAALTPHGGGGFKWADPELEALSRAQKHLLRTGPRNVRLIQAKLRELQAALAQ